MPLARTRAKAGIARPAGTAAHRIVPAGLKKFRSAEKARDILTKFGIGVENAANSVYLPSRFDEAVRAAYHGTLHSKRYFDEVLKRLQKARSKEEALVILNQIRKELLAGTFPH
jgi:HNH/ENDO VII superfamily nuclease